ncbi:hypothetical protein D1007_15031 [Hordeum vulgare]|nr:hypothetical protein D1007_15031 [Hordeum vulgare]
MVHHPVNQLQNELTQAAPTPAPAPELEPAQAQGGHTSLWHSEKMVGTQIELLLLLYVVIGAIQVVGSRYRRTINSAYVKYPLWMAYSASQPLVAYTLAVMYNSPFKETQSLLTTLFVVVALGRVNTMTAYKVDDNKRYAAHFFRHVLFVVSFMSMVITIPHVSGFKGWYILIMYPIVVFLLIFFLTMNGGRACANIMASSFSDKGSLYLQTHMKTEHLVELPYDPVSLKGYNYLVLSFDEEKKEHRKDKRERIVEVKENDDDDKEEDVELDEKNGEEEKDLEKDDESDQEKEEIVEVKEKDDDNDNDHDDEEEEEQMKEMDDDYDEGEEKSDDEDEPYHITVSMVWRSLSGPFGESEGPRLKELCLSFALFQLLRRRFFGADCPEAKLQKTHDLVFKGLLLDVERNYQGAYRIIETELAFTYDHFFSTTNSLFSERGIVDICLSIFCVAVIYPSGITSLIKHLLHYKQESLSSPSTVPWGRTGILICVVLVMLSLALELLQLYVLISSDWAKVELANRIVFMKGKPLPSFVLRTPLPGLYFRKNLPQLFGYWQNKIGQHSLIKDLHGKSFIPDLVGSLSYLFKSINSYTPAFPRGFFDRGLKKADRIPLTDTIKLAIARTLKDSNGQLLCGVPSLQRIFQGEEIPLWACNHENPARTMLIWHVATEYCVIAQSLKPAELELNHIVAQEISSYCAYLMAFVPELLPDHPLETTRLFHEVRNQALNLLRKDRTPAEKYKKMRIYNRQHETTFAAGIQLGKKLEKMGDDSSRWKILADLWTEMILYVAPSDNAKDHIQHLANGGEFITHLWALLSHAGILERDQQIHGHPPAECSASREPTTYADEQTCRNDHQLDPSVQATKLQQTEVEMTTPMECRIDISEVSSSTKQP